jgi:hypothetical protein
VLGEESLQRQRGCQGPRKAHSAWEKGVEGGQNLIPRAGGEAHVWST